MSGTRPPTWTETTIETAIDTLANLTSVQGRTITLADAGADVLWGWDDSGAVYDNFALADITTEASPAAGDFVLIYGAEGDLRKANWNTLPGTGGGISNVVEDLTPELGGDLESNNFDIIMEQFSADAVSGEIKFHKSRNASIGSHTVINAFDNIGLIRFEGSDGDQFITAAMIVGYVSGTPGNNDMPGGLTFYTTPDGSDTPVSRLAIYQNGTSDFGDIGYANSTLNITTLTSATNSVVNPLSVLTGSSGTPAAGFGTGVSFVVETAADNYEIGATVQAVATDVTSTSEDFDLRFATMTAGAAATERLRIDSQGRVHIGSGAIQTTMFAGTAALEIDNSGSDFGGDISQYHYGANANGTSILVHKARSESFGAVSSGDTLGSMWWAGADGDQWVVGADIAVVVDATPGNNDMPTRMEFGTTVDGGTFPTIRFTIKSDGRLVAANGAIPHFWVYWTANSTTILASYNMTSIADTGVGDADGTIGIDFSSVNWAGFVNTNDATNGWDAEEVQSSGFNARAAGTFGVLCSTITDGGTAATSLTDPEQWQVVGFGVSV